MIWYEVTHDLFGKAAFVEGLELIIRNLFHEEVTALLTGSKCW
jgi:hypothetical protein